MYRIIKASTNSSYFDRFNTVMQEYVSPSGEGDTMANQICTAVNKLIYRWYNDGDVFHDVHGFLDGTSANDISSYANWLYKYVPESKDILSTIYDIFFEGPYTDLLKHLADALLNRDILNYYESMPQRGTIYNCTGPFEVSGPYDEYNEYDDYIE